MSSWFKVQGIIKGLLSLILSICCGCAYVPSTKVDAIYKKGNTLYIATSDGAIKTFDAQSHQLKNRIEFPGMQYGRQYYAPRVTKIFEDNNRIYLQVHQGNQNKIYVLNNGKAIQEVASLGSPMILTVDGKDDKYYYINMTSGSTFRGFRLDKSFRTRIEGHFDNLKDLMLIDSFEDRDHYWYACINTNEIEFDVKRTPEVLMQLTLIAKKKSSADSKLVELGQVGTDKLYIVDGGAALWIFSGDKLFKVQKENMSYALIELPLPLVPVFDTATDNSAYIWSMNNKFGSNESLIFKINKATAEIVPTPVYFDSAIRIPTFAFERKVWADDNYLWLYSEITKTPGAPSGNFSPYLLQISKNNLTSVPLLIKPTIGEAISTVSYNFFAILTSPIWAHKQ
ncbi:MAG: hypothetical protein ABSA46_10925 [Thermodesulfovibrionales bacterium]|jgi:hypothetical protein